MLQEHRLEGQEFLKWFFCTVLWSPFCRQPRDACSFFYCLFYVCLYDSIFSLCLSLSLLFFSFLFSFSSSSSSSPSSSFFLFLWPFSSLLFWGDCLGFLRRLLRFFEATCRCRFRPTDTDLDCLGFLKRLLKFFEATASVFFWRPLRFFFPATCRCRFRPTDSDRTRQRWNRVTTKFSCSHGWCTCQP